MRAGVPGEVGRSRAREEKKKVRNSTSRNANVRTTHGTSLESLSAPGSRFELMASKWEPPLSGRLRRPQPHTPPLRASEILGFQRPRRVKILEKIARCARQEDIQT